MLGRFRRCCSPYILADFDEELSEGGGRSSLIEGSESLFNPPGDPVWYESSGIVRANVSSGKGEIGTSKSSS